MGRLDGKVALITGAARGQGRSHAVGLAREGADIIAVDLCAQIDTVMYPMATPEDLEETTRLVEEEDRRIFARVADVRDQAALGAVVRDGVAELGGLDIVLANAGIWAVHLDEPTDTAVRQKIWQDTISTNLTGAWNTIEVAAPIMIDAGRGGAIVITASTQGLKGAANNDISLTAYTASKHGVVGLMRASAIDLAPHSIRVNSVHPTGVVTPMIDNEVVPAYAEKHKRFAEITANLLPVPALDPEDITNAVLYLVTDTGRYVTGVALPVDAGYLVS
ncbi:MAG: mycofactocin-coupled SDR family oxidoreductase [Solirubrobacteraceae bacterium]